MIKITYLESGLLLEHLPLPVETWIARRSRLSARLGIPLTVQPTRACLPLSRHLPELGQFLPELEQGAIAVDICDRHYLEITLPGTWVADHGASDVGIFVTSLKPCWEEKLLSLWQRSQAGVTVSRAPMGP
ncbi:hypothetical protein C7271_11880 [filamentous cyanobacterium CCP5]|nr:hypothetical protein C7271_11880 [filamentous cyanobacterium CCP5]